MPYSDPTLRRRAAREAMRRRRARERGTPLIPLARPAGATALSPRDLAHIIAEELAWLRQRTEPGDGERCRIVAQLATVALRCFEVGDLAARLERLESALEAQEDSDARTN